MKSAAEDYRAEHFAYGENELHGGALFESMEYDQWIDLVEKNSRRETVDPEWMLSSTFFACRESDGRIIGMADIRLELNEFGREFAGNIGYGVRPSERRKGYAVQILKQALEYAAGHGIDPAMVCCYEDNTASARTIERCGGINERRFPHMGKTVLVYKVPTGLNAEREV